MDLQTIAAASVILGGVAFTFGVLIALANRKLKVWEDPRINAVTEMLPGSNCGTCGQPGCRAFAEALASGQAQPAGCTVMGATARDEVAAYLGVDAGEAVKRVARLRCAGGAANGAGQQRGRCHTNRKILSESNVVGRHSPQPRGSAREG